MGTARMEIEAMVAGVIDTSLYQAQWHSSDATKAEYSAPTIGPVPSAKGVNGPSSTTSDTASSNTPAITCCQPANTLTGIGRANFLAHRVPAAQQVAVANISNAPSGARP